MYKHIMEKTNKKLPWLARVDANIVRHSQTLRLEARMSLEEARRAQTVLCFHGEKRERDEGNALVYLRGKCRGILLDLLDPLLAPLVGGL